MGLIDTLKQEAKSKGISVSSVDEQRFEQYFNRMFYLDKDIDNELKFLKMVMTRGAETQERVGLHASAITKGSDTEFCVREQVLSLLYKQNQGDNIPVKLKRIFEEGNAIHEKWQRLFIRAGYADWWDCDRTCYHDKYMISYTPDIICFCPELHKEEMIGEIKSMNDWSYSRQSEHTEGQKQLQWYLHLRGLKKGFVLAEDKNDQNYRIELVDYDIDKVKPFIARAERVRESYDTFIATSKLPSQRADITSKKCKQCSMHDACFNVGLGRIKI